MSAGVIAVDGSDAPACYQPDASDCVGRPEVAGCRANLCCSGLKYGAADNGTTWALGSGTCTCCTKGYCRTSYGGAIGTTPNTQSDAEAVDIKCKLIAV